MNKRIVLALILLALLLLPMLCCAESGYLPEQDASVEQAEHTIKVNLCSQECDGVQSCVEECVNR